MNKIYKLMLLFFLTFSVGELYAQCEGDCASICPGFRHDANATNGDDPVNGSGSETVIGLVGGVQTSCECDYQSGGGNNKALSGCDGGTALPVEFLYFKAQPDTKFIKLEWATASEINNAFFSVEYSRDGNGYKEIGRVAGHGNSVETIEYEFMHETPLVGENFYRLRQEDFDGTFEYSEIAQIQLEGDQGVSIRPNLVQGELTVVVNKGYEKDTEGIIYDLVGSAVMTVTFPANTAMQTFDLGDLPNGHYLFHLQDGISSHVGRFVKAGDY